KMKFMNYAVFFYASVGIEPYTKSSRSQKKSHSSDLLFWANVINLSVNIAGEIMFLCMSLYNGQLIEAVTVMSYIGFVFVGMSKMFFIWSRKRALSSMVDELEMIYPPNPIQEEKYRLHSYLRSCSRISITYSLLYLVLIWTFNLFNMMQYLVYEKWLKIRTVGQTLPYSQYFPWVWEGNLSFYLQFLSQNFAGHSSASGQISTDLLLCAVATQVVMHFDYLGRALENHKLTGDWKKDSKFLVKTVRYHQRILRLTQVINEIFGLPLLLNFLVSTFVICFVGFQMTVGVPPDLLVKLFLFLFCSMCQVYLICHHGQLIADASSGLAIAAYNQNWSYADVRYRRALVFIIARSQKITYLKATVFMNITSATMTDILQTSYKFFALLRTMYVK
ncbi:hypothetical protein KR067_011817, partial [Drosophila pandora]